MWDSGSVFLTWGPSQATKKASSGSEKSMTLPMPTWMFAYWTFLRAPCCVAMLMGCTCLLGSWDFCLPLPDCSPFSRAVQSLTICQEQTMKRACPQQTAAPTVMGFLKRMNMTFRPSLTRFTSTNLAEGRQVALCKIGMRSRRLLFPVLFQLSTISEHWVFCCSY